MTTRPDDFTINHVHRVASEIQDPQHNTLPGLTRSDLISIGTREHPKGQRHFLIRVVQLRENECVTQAVETNQHLTEFKDGPIITIVDDTPQDEEVWHQLIQLLNGCIPMDLTPIGQRLFFPIPLDQAAASDLPDEQPTNPRQTPHKPSPKKAGARTRKPSQTNKEGN